MGTLRRHYPESIKKEAVKAVKSGMSLIDVSKAMDIPDTTIHNWVKKSGKKLRYPQKAHHFSDADKELALELLESGRSPTQIAGAIGCSPWTVTVWKRAADADVAMIMEVKAKEEAIEKEFPPVNSGSKYRLKVSPAPESTEPKWGPLEVATALLDRIVSIIKGDDEEKEVMKREVESLRREVESLRRQLAEKIAELNRVVKIHNEQVKAHDFTTSEELIKLARHKNKSNGG